MLHSPHMESKFLHRNFLTRAGKIQFLYLIHSFLATGIMLLVILMTPLEFLQCVVVHITHAWLKTCWYVFKSMFAGTCLKACFYILYTTCNPYIIQICPLSFHNDKAYQNTYPNHILAPAHLRHKNEKWAKRIFVQSYCVTWTT